MKDKHAKYGPFVERCYAAIVCTDIYIYIYVYFEYGMKVYYNSTLGTSVTPPLIIFPHRACASPFIFWSRIDSQIFECVRRRGKVNNGVVIFKKLPNIGGNNG